MAETPSFAHGISARVSQMLSQLYDVHDHLFSEDEDVVAAAQDRLKKLESVVKLHNAILIVADKELKITGAVNKQAEEHDDDASLSPDSGNSNTHRRASKRKTDSDLARSQSIDELHEILASVAGKAGIPLTPEELKRPSFAGDET